MDWEMEKCREPHTGPGTHRVPGPAVASLPRSYSPGHTGPPLQVVQVSENSAFRNPLKRRTSEHSPSLAAIPCSPDPHMMPGPLPTTSLTSSQTGLRALATVPVPDNTGPAPSWSDCLRPTLSDPAYCLVTTHPSNLNVPEAGMRQKGHQGEPALGLLLCDSLLDYSNSEQPTRPMFKTRWGRAGTG